MAIVEVCIAAHDFGPGRAQEGDIIAIREPQLHIGLKEGRDFLWFLADDSELPDPALLEGDAPGLKKRFNIPLARLQAKFGQFNLSRARNPDDWYQPFRGTDTGGMHRSEHALFTLRDIMVDKRSGIS